MRYLSRSAKVCLAVYGFTPWLLVLLFQFVFVPVSWFDALMFIGPIWVAISPLFVYVTVASFSNEAVAVAVRDALEVERAQQHVRLQRRIAHAQAAS